MNPETFARLAKRLESRPDRSDHGQRLPELRAALELPEGPQRLSAVVSAIGAERIIVPVPVESHPDQTGEHRPQDLSPDASVPLAIDEHAGISAIAIFSDADSLLRWDPEARPLAMDAQKAALTAASTGIPRLRLNPGAESIVIPRPAVEALASGGTWLPAWDDPSLAESLGQEARDLATWADFIEVTVLPGDNGSVRVEVLAAPKQVDPALVRASFAALLTALGKNPRLAGGTETVQFVPRLAAQT